MQLKTLLRRALRPRIPSPTRVRPLPPGRATDRGVSTIELVVTVMIMGVIAIPLSNALLGFIFNTDDTTRRMSQSHDIQLAAAYFAQDVQAVGTHDWAGYSLPLQQSVELDVAADGGLYPCGDPRDIPHAVLRLAWDDPQAATGLPSVVRISYVVVVTGDERQLHRIQCIGSATVTSDIVVAHNVDTTPPVVTCSSTCTSPVVPQKITLTLTIRDINGQDTPQTVVLTGQRRQ